jgi:hypothetical protein
MRCSCSRSIRRSVAASQSRHRLRSPSSTTNGSNTAATPAWTCCPDALPPVTESATDTTEEVAIPASSARPPQEDTRELSHITPAGLTAHAAAPVRRGPVVERRQHSGWTRQRRPSASSAADLRLRGRAERTGGENERRERPRIVASAWSPASNPAGAAAPGRPNDPLPSRLRSVVPVIPLVRISASRHRGSRLRQVAQRKSRDTPGLRDAAASV